MDHLKNVPRNIDESRVLPSLGRRTLLLLVGTVFSLATLQGLLFTVTTAISPEGLGSVSDLLGEILTEAIYLYSIAALVLPVFWLADRLGMASASLRRAILLHVPVATLYVVTQIGITGLLWWLTNTPFMEGPLWSSMAHLLRFQYSTQIIFYLLIATGYHLLAHLVHVYAHINELERQRQRNAALETQRVRSLRRFAGGIAHELNNVLTAVSGHFALMRMARTRTEQDTSAADIDVALERIGKLGQELQSMGMGRPFQPRPFDVNPVIEEAIAQLAGKTANPVRIDAPTRVGASGDPERLRDVLLGLALLLDTQSRDHVSTVIRLRDHAVDQSGAMEPAPARCHIIIENTAASFESAENLLEPGMIVRHGRVTLDLTLATADALVTQMGGSLAVSRDGGTTLDISLPTAA